MTQCMKRILSITLCAMILVSLLPVSGNAVKQNSSVMPRAVFQWGPDTFSLVGSGLPGIRQWDPADPAGHMENVNYSEFLYEIVLKVTAGTSMSFKFTGNDQWDEEWTFGGTGLVLGQTTKLVQGADSPDLKLSFTEDCLLRFTVDFTDYARETGDATVLVSKVNPPTFRTLSVYAPTAWKNVFVYAEGSKVLSPFPGYLIPEVNYYHQLMIPVEDCNLVISGITADGTVISTEVITLEDNLRDVGISLNNDTSYYLWYDRLEEPVYRLDGNADWMNAGVLKEVSAGVYEKTARNVDPGNYWFFISRDDRSDSPIGQYPDEAFRFQLPEACDVTVRYTLPDNRVAIFLDNQLLLSGDTTTDGKLNIGDVSKLYAHIRGAGVLKGIAALINADLTGDGNLNLGDTARLYAYIRGTDAASLVDTAYQLPVNHQSSFDCTISGTVLEILKPYTPKDPTVTLDLVVPGREHRPIRCVTTLDIDATHLSVGDEVTVCGRLRNHYGTVQMSNPCQLLQWDDLRSTEEDMIALLERSYNETLTYPVNITGKVTYRADSYPPEANAVDLLLQIGTGFYEVFCSNAVGEMQDDVTIGCTVTVSGYLEGSFGSWRIPNAQIISSDMELPEIMETDPLKLIDMASKLPNDEFIPYPVTLQGCITEIDSIYNAQEQYMSVTMVVPGAEDFPIYCPDLTGPQVGNHLCVGDTITVTGMLLNYYGVQFDSKCKLIDWQPGDTKIPTDPKKIVDAAFLLKPNESLPYVATLTGTVKSIDVSYNEIFENITVTITVQSSSGPKNIVCSRLRGEGVDQLKPGDTITVTGIIEHYYSQNSYPRDYIQFSPGCQLK